MKNLKLNELSKQQMRQLTGGEERHSGTGNYNGHQAKVSWTVPTPHVNRHDGSITVSYEICCVCGCRYANQGGSSTDANFTANDAQNLKSF